MLFASALAAASVVWIAVLVVAAAGGDTAGGAAVRTFASFVCHQLPDRSFMWNGVPWPVCARCLGLYAAAPLGALAALFARGSRTFDARLNIRVLGMAAAPTLLTWVAEFIAGLPMTNAARFGAALPLGAAVAWLLVRTAIDARGRGVSQYTLTDARRGSTR